MLPQFSTEHKKAIRTNWAKPLLSFLHDILGKKLFYLGLPGEKAYDIYEWLEHLDVVYAFECGNYKGKSDPEEGRKKLLALENIGLALQRRRQLSDFQLYDGYIEEVLVRGFDNSASQKDFIQSDVVTVYNLDFCNQVASPIEYRDKAGDFQKAYKFDAIRRLMEIQKTMAPSSKKFIMFLTLHCSYSGEEFKNFYNSPPSGHFKTYLKATEKLSSGKKAPYWVKAFVFHHLTESFKDYHFIPEFLPVIHYIGDGGKPLLCFTVIGTQSQNQEKIGQAQDFLNGKFISVDSDSIFINNNDLVLHEEKNWEDLNPLDLFKSSNTYKENWNNAK